MKRRETFATVEVVVATALWALTFILVKLAQREMSDVTVITLRFGVGALVTLFYAWSRGELSGITWQDIKGLAVLGLIGTTIHQLLQVTGQRITDASMAALCAATAPAFLVITAAIFLKERPRVWQTVGVAIALGGAFLLSVDWNNISGLSFSTGAILVLLSSAAWAIAGVMYKHMMRKRTSGLVTSGALFFGWLFILPLFVSQHAWHDIPRIGFIGWMSVVVMGLFCTAITNLLNNHALKYLQAQRVAVIYNLEPFVAVSGAWLILNEHIGWMMVAGGALIVTGVFLSERFGTQEKGAEKNLFPDSPAPEI